MDNLNKIILSLEKEEIRQFKYYVHRMDSSETRKDMQLFDYIRKSKLNFDENAIFKLLYNGDLEFKNSYSRLKNRLLNDIYTWITLRNANSSSEIELMNTLIVCDFLIEKKLFDLALKDLKKAEKKAIEKSALDILDLIYTHILKIAEYLPEIDVNAFIEKRKVNFNTIQQVREIDDIVSSMTFRIRTTQNFENEVHSGIEDLEKIVAKNSNLANNDIPVIKIKIYEAISKMLLQKHEYDKLEKYLIPTYNLFEQQNIFNKERHVLKIQMLIYIANALFKNRKFEDSLLFAPKILEAINDLDGIYYDKYVFFYYNILVINYSEIDYKKALVTLEEIKDQPTIIQSNFYNFVLLNLALLYYRDKNFKNSLKHLLLLYKNKTYLASSLPFKLRVEIFELIVRFELKDNELINYRFKQIQSDYVELLSLSENERYYKLLQLIDKMSELAELDLKKNTKVLKLASEFLSNSIDAKQKDSEIIDYELWVKQVLFIS